MFFRRMELGGAPERTELYSRSQGGRMVQGMLRKSQEGNES